MEIKKNTPYVYQLIDSRNGEPFYVGKGTGDRLFKHTTHAHTKTSNPIKSNKIDSIICEGGEVQYIVEYCPTDDDAYDLERSTNEQLGRVDLGTGPLTNCSNGGRGGNRGFVFTPEQKSKLKNRKRGSKTPDGLRRISEANSKPKTSEQIKNITAGSSRAKRVYQFQNGELIATYPSAREAMRQTGVDNVQISRCCKGSTGPTAGGYQWYYNSQGNTTQLSST